MKRLLLILLGTICFNAQATPNDPYESFNRGVYSFNQQIDRYLLKPIAKAYKKILPSVAIKGIGNFFSNLNQVPIIANDLLQLDFYNVASDSWRFFFNSTLGILGFMDVASDLGLAKHPNDFGLTLAKWGYSSSNYLVLPILGPSTVRDTISLPIDYNFLSVYPHIEPSSDRSNLLSLNLINQRARLLDLENIMEQAALDKYVFQRDAYLQQRANLICQHSGNVKKIDDTDF